MWKVSIEINFSLDLLLNAILFSLIAFGITAGVSSLSYHLFEKQFFKIKEIFLLKSLVGL